MPFAAVEKVVTVFGMRAGVEAAYAGGGVLTDADDAVQMLEMPEFTPDHLWSGDRGMGPGGPPLVDSPPIGYQAEFPYRVAFKGAGSAYSASNRARDIKVGMRISGHAVVVDATGGAEKETHTPIASGFASGVFDLFSYAEKRVLTGAVADLIIMGEENGPIVFEFPLRGLLSLPVDAAVPALVYAESVTPPNNTNIVFSLGAGTPFINGRVAAWRFEKRAQVLGPRTDHNAAGGHAGFGLGPGRSPRLFVTLERTSRSGVGISPYYTASQINPEQLRELKSKLAWSLGPIGGTDYNRLKISGPQAQIVGVEDVTLNDGIAGWRIELKITPTTTYALDDYTILLPRN